MAEKKLKDKKEENKSSANTTEEKIKKALEKVRPMMKADGGDVKFVEWDEKKGVVKVQLQGMCVGCPMSAITLQEGIGTEIKKDVPEVKEVISV